MSDFDFDELDKAVAGASGSDVNQVITDIEEPEEQRVVEIDSKPEASESEAPKAAPAARRGSGRFMDVVHPSSDMRSRASSVAPSSRTEAPSFVPPASKVEEEAPEEEESTSDIKDTQESAVGEWSKPLETPFLADAKVEKRPLGGFGPDPSQELLDAPEEEPKPEAPDEPLLEANNLPDPIDFAAHLASLDSEKEDTGNPAPVEEEKPEEPQESEQSIEQLDELKEPEPETPPVLDVATSEEPVGPTSIQQQYEERPATEQPSGAIYDTENYHKPLAPPAKKKSGAWTIIWIILLVILGAAAGVAFYLYVLPML